MNEKSSKNYLGYLACILAGSLIGWGISKRLGVAWVGKLFGSLGRADSNIDDTIRHTEQGLDILRKYLR